jgi:hypothetical protein
MGAIKGMAGLKAANPQGTKAMPGTMMRPRGKALTHKVTAKKRMPAHNNVKMTKLEKKYGKFLD